MTACDAAGLLTKVLPHLNIKYKMALDLMISWRYITLWFLPGIKFRADILHILTHRVPPQCIPIFTVKLNCLLHILRDLYTELVSIQQIIEFYFCNYAVPLLQSMRHPPSEGGIY